MRYSYYWQETGKNIRYIAFFYDIVYNIVRLTYAIEYDIVYYIVCAIGNKCIFTCDIVCLYNIVHQKYDIVRQTYDIVYDIVYDLDIVYYIVRLTYDIVFHVPVNCHS